MAWIESHQGLGRHPKLFKLASQLRIHKAQAIGHLQYLWWWSLDFAPTGNLSVFAPAEVSAGAEWPGEPGQFHKALIDCGWIDTSGFIHDWQDYAGKLVDQREKDRLRKKNERNSKGCPPVRPADGGRTADVENPTEPTEPTEPNTPPDPQGGKRAAADAGEEDPIPDGFAEFWAAWPRSQRKQGKPSCLKIWKKQKLEESADAIISTLSFFKKSSDWTKEAGQFIPLPSTWLNRASWETDPADLVQPPQKNEYEFSGWDENHVRPPITPEIEALMGWDKIPPRPENGKH